MIRQTIFPNSGLLLIGILTISGCVNKPPFPYPTMLSNSTGQQDTLIREAKAETASLRSSLASERIKSAKQAAHLRLLEEQTTSLRDREADNTATITRLQSEIDVLRQERDRLRKENSDLRAQTASLPDLLKMVTQLRTVETSLTGMTSSLTGVSSSIQNLSGEVSHIKKEIKEQQVATANAKRTRPSRVPKKIDPSQTEMITVARGDSLWRLARQFGTSIAQLKTLNKLTGDQIIVGQQLRVPRNLPEPQENVAGTPSKDKTPNP